MATKIRRISFPTSSRWIYAYMECCDGDLAIWYKDRKGLPSVCCKYKGGNGAQFYNLMRSFAEKGQFVWQVLPYRHPYTIVAPPKPPWQSQCANIQFRSSSTGTFTAGSATAAITVPSGSLAADVLVAFFCSESAPGGQVFTAPSGWTVIAPGFYQNGPSSETPPTSVVLYGFWALGSVANLTFTQSDPANSNSGWACLAFSGVDNTNPVDALGTSSEVLGTPNANITANAVTTVTDGALEVIGAGDVSTNDSISNPAFTEVNGFTVPKNVSVLYANSPTSPPGSTGNFTLNDDGDFTGSGFVNNILCQPFALRPG
jgi:hypothetical protein